MADTSRLDAIQGRSFDVAVIGGGIVGCGVARDAALRGLSVVLLEQSDFGSGTTSASTRIVHGGLRYLETGDFRLVRLDLRERETLLHIAPHLVRPLEFVIPFRHVHRLQRMKLRAGLTLYDALAWGSSLPRHRTSAHEAVYYDARVDSPERLCVENVLDAEAHGAQAFNYVEVIGALRTGDGIAGVRVRDCLTNANRAIAARVIVNASGPWFEQVASSLTGELPGRIRATKGIHLVCPRMSDHAQVLFSSVDGRLLFAIPRAGHTWIGTTDTDYAGDPSNAAATREDVTYLVESVRATFPQLTRDDVLYTTAGVRALVMQPGRASAVSRLHRIVVGEVGGGRGLVSIMGAKITGYRAIAEDATDAVCRILGRIAPAITATTPLPGARTTSAVPGSSHLYDLYGGRAAAVLSVAAEHPRWSRPLSPLYPDIAAQVVLAVRAEHCLTLGDFLRRRTLLGATADQGWSAAPVVADMLAHELGWSDSRREREIEGYARDIAKTVAFRVDGIDRVHTGTRER